MKYIYSLVILSLLFSCSKIPDTRYFTLAHKSAESQNSGSDKVLVIKKIKSDPIYQQDKFVYRPSEYEIKFDHYRRWVQSPPQILTNRLKEYLKSRNDFKYVSSELYQNERYLQLDCTLVRFEEIITGSKRDATVAVEYKLLQMPQEQLLTSGTIEKTEAISGNSAEDIVKAMSTATFNVFSSLAGIIQE